jgi:hypothetical protein
MALRFNLNGRSLAVNKRKLQGAFLFLISLFLASTAMAIEIPKYSVLESSNSFELRAYEPLILAEVQVEGHLDDASSQGFRLIAAYIFGKNQANDKISMTAPVTIESKSTESGQKIAMTVPVTIQAGNSKGGVSTKKSWTVSFVMPSEYTLATLPKPLDPKVLIKELPAEKKAVISFSGFYSEDKVTEKTKALQDWIKEKNWQSIGEPQFARYNPPWTLPFLRRNEVLIQVRD